MTKQQISYEEFIAELLGYLVKARGRTGVALRVDVICRNHFNGRVPKEWFSDAPYELERRGFGRIEKIGPGDVRFEVKGPGFSSYSKRQQINSSAVKRMMSIGPEWAAVLISLASFVVSLLAIFGH